MASLQDEDDGVFAAALSFVDEFEFAADGFNLLPKDVAIQPCEERVASPSVALAVVDRAQPLTQQEKRRLRAEKKRLLRKAGVYSDPNRARNEQTREIAFLREQLEKLQLDLKVLQTRRGDRALVALDKPSQKPGLWQEQATRQRRRREQAECDNVRLKLAVERQRKCCVNHPTIDVLDFCGDVEDFRGLFYRLDEAYRDMDAVFAANGLATLSIPIGDVHMREGKYLEFFTYKDLPFSQEDTAQASWDYFKGAEKHMAYGSLYEKAAKSMDEPYTVIEEFTKEVYSNSSRADVKMRQVVRRYVESDRDIVIRVSHAAPIEVKNKMLRGLTHNVRGFAITKRSPASTATRELTQLQLCTQIALELQDGATYDPKNVRALTNFLIAHGLKNTVVNCEYIENALADRALRRQIE
ncbi:unnamed protein product [Phytophthora lilii]|uniref:Unnamed protein product n=1 Tax=Phytophthora lilii TaxID=2077276 RepID=A0A9W6WVI4_9STRA|nr:unnamed protein product [Phytophthora lilii]